MRSLTSFLLGGLERPAMRGGGARPRIAEQHAAPLVQGAGPQRFCSGWHQRLRPPLLNFSIRGEHHSIQHSHGLHQHAQDSLDIILMEMELKG